MNRRYGNYIIREIEEKDNLEIEQVIRHCLIEYDAAREGTAWTDPNLDSFSKIYNTMGNKYWVVEDRNGRIVAGCGIGKLKGMEGIGEIQKMYFMPEVRHLGIAHKLIDIVLDYASMYYNKVYLETLSNMIEAQRFYEKHGFVKLDKPITQTDHFACDVCYIKEI